jgi:hypothetical protein
LLKGVRGRKRARRPTGIDRETLVGERAVLTSRFAEAPSASRSAASAGAAIVLSVVTWTLAHAGSVDSQSCVGGPRSFNCVGQWAPAAGDPYVRIVPDPVDEAQRAQMARRDRKWLARCRPVVERDDYGVARYHYAAQGCEFGVGPD